MASVVSRALEDAAGSGSTSPDCSANMWMSCGENARSRLALSPMAIVEGAVAQNLQCVGSGIDRCGRGRHLPFPRRV